MQLYGQATYSNDRLMISRKGESMRYQNIELPKEAVKIGETPWFTENSVPQGILNNHMAPKEKVGYVVVKHGSLDYVWEDDLDDVITADSNHPIVIEPERYHHIIITGKVVFKVEFYDSKNLDVKESDPNAPRPGESFIEG